MKKYFISILFFAGIKAFSQSPVNGLQVIGANFGVGGSLIQNTQVNIDTFDLEVKNDSITFFMGEIPVISANTYIPFYGLRYGDALFGRLDTRGIGASDQWTITHNDKARQTSNGLNVRKEQFSLSIYDNINCIAKYEYGFTGYPTNADHFAYDRAINLDVTLIKAHLNYGRIQHWYDTTVASGMHYNEVFVSDKIYLKTDLDTAIITQPGAMVSMPGKKTGGTYFINNQILSSNSASVKGTVTQIGLISSPVLLNTPIGTINTAPSLLAAGGTATFQVNNTLVNLNSSIIVTVRSVTAGIPYVYIINQGSGFFTLRIANLSTTTAFNSNLRINFIVN